MRHPGQEKEMGSMEQFFYVGIDLDDENAVISCYEQNKKEPETFGMVAGSEVYQIPTVVTKKKGIGQWYIGDEARRAARAQGGGSVGALLSLAAAEKAVVVDGEQYQGEELLELFLRKLLRLAGGLGREKTPDALAICVEALDRTLANLFMNLGQKLGIPAKQLLLLNRRECFYYFVYHQNKELWLHDVMLYDYRGTRMLCERISRNRRTVPQMITISGESREICGADSDAAFLRAAEETMKGHIVSAVYLVGDGFDGGWMKRSAAFCCRGRRAFVGKNLYSKGACYAAAVQKGREPWNYVYLGDNEMKLNVSLKVQNKRKEEFYSLLTAGENWYEAAGECEVILAGTPEINFWLQLPGSREAKVEKLRLSDLPKRPDKTTRLRITAKPLSDCTVQIRIKDLGFGELFAGSGKVWEYKMSL